MGKTEKLLNIHQSILPKYIDILENVEYEKLIYFNLFAKTLLTETSKLMEKLSDFPEEMDILSNIFKYQKMAKEEFETTLNEICKN